MKKYVSCFLFFFLLTSASLITLFLLSFIINDEITFLRHKEIPFLILRHGLIFNLLHIQDHRPLHPYAPGGIPGGGAGAADDGDLVSDNG